MKSETKIIVALVVVTLLSVGVYAYAKKEQERKTNPAGDLSNPRSDASLRKKIQDWINGVMTGTNGANNEYGADGARQSANVLYQVDTHARGGAHGVKDTADNAKQFIFRLATQGSTYTGTWDQYNYPGIEHHSVTNGGVQTNSGAGVGGVIDEVIHSIPGGGIVSSLIDLL